MWIRVGFPEEQRAGMPRNANDRRRFLIPIQVLSILLRVGTARQGFFPLKPLLCLSLPT